MRQSASSSNSYPVKDGTRRKAKPHWKFQSLGPRGKRKYKNIPAALVPRVRKLIENGRRYRKLEAEYSRLVTEESLAALKKRQAKADPPATAPRQHHRSRRVNPARRCEGKAQGATALRRRPREGRVEGHSRDARMREHLRLEAAQGDAARRRGVPIPIAGSFSYSVTDLGIGELTSLIHEQAVSRGSGSVPRVQCVADGEEALEKAMRDALPFARFALTRGSGILTLREKGDDLKSRGDQ